MSLINAAALADVMKGVRTNFNLGLDDAKSAEDLDRWKMFAEEPKPRSKKKKEDLTWIKAVASLIPWIGTKEIIKLEAGGFEVEHRKFHRTIEIDEDDIADAAALLSLANIARKIGHAAMEWPNEMVLGLFNGIFTGEKCYTGKNFAATNHRIARKNFSNKLTTALSAADKASAKASVGAAILAMRKAWDDSGRIVRAKPTTLVVPPDLEETADLLCNNKQLEDRSPNPYYGKLKSVVEEAIESPTEWHVLGRAGMLSKPFIWWPRQAARIVSQTGEESEARFMNGKFRLGAEARAIAAYGAPQLIQSSTGTG